jgi:hypothetical protein
MNIVMRYLGLGVEGIPLKQLERILTGNDTVKVKMTGKGMLILSDKKMIKCVKEYYINPNAESTSKIKASNQCYYTQRDMNITGVANYSCLSCHQKCIELHSNRDLLLR